MTTIYIIRHAEAEGNLYRRCHGHYDGKITPNGYKQIELLRNRLKNIKIDALYSSDLSRTKTTAGAVLDGRSLRPNVSPRLREISLGVWEDLPWGQVMREYGPQYEAFSKGFGFVLQGAETCEQVRKRMYGAIGDIAAKHQGQSVAVVSHGMAIRLFLCEAAGIPPEETYKVKHVDNASVTQINWGEKPEIAVLGDSSYLGGLSTFHRQSWWREGGKDVNLWFRPAAFPMEEKLALGMKLDAWRSVYGTGQGFDNEQMGAELRRHHSLSPLAVKFSVLGDLPVGLMQIAPDADCSPDECHITLFYLAEEYCGNGLGAQLLGEAVSVARKFGKAALRLRVWEKNARALAFYVKHGFVETGKQYGVFGSLIVMRKEI